MACCVRTALNLASYKGGRAGTTGYNFGSGISGQWCIVNLLGLGFGEHIILAVNRSGVLALAGTRISELGLPDC